MPDECPGQPGLP